MKRKNHISAVTKEGLWAPHITTVKVRGRISDLAHYTRFIDSINRGMEEDGFYTIDSKVRVRNHEVNIMPRR